MTYVNRIGSGGGVTPAAHARSVRMTVRPDRAVATAIRPRRSCTNVQSGPVSRVDQPIAMAKPSTACDQVPRLRSGIEIPQEINEAMRSAKYHRYRQGALQADATSEKIAAVHSSVYYHRNRTRARDSRDTFMLNRANSVSEWRGRGAALDQIKSFGQVHM